MSAPFRLTDTLTYWPPAGWDGRGNKTFSAPTTITGRWEANKRLITDGNGNEIMAEADVAVDQDVENEGFLARGDQTGTTDPADANGAFRIVRFKSARSLARGRTYRKATVGAS